MTANRLDLRQRTGGPCRTLTFYFDRRRATLALVEVQG